MPTAETAEPAPANRARPGRLWIWAGLAAVLGGGLSLRLWGVRQGLPFAYSTDEGQHFVPHAVRMFAEGTLNPRYFENPPAFTYLLHVLYGLWYGGAGAVTTAFRLHPQDLYTLARVASALLGTAALWLLYLTGARLFGRAVGLLAAAIEAVAFLPVFYAHLALNDAPTLAPLTLSLLGTAGILRKGRARDHLIAGVGLGLACATKYTAGIVLLPLLAAIAARYLRRTAAPGHGLLWAALRSPASARLGAFLVANPYAVLDYSASTRSRPPVEPLSRSPGQARGAPQRRPPLLPVVAYVGPRLGPALAALGGAVTIWRSGRAPGWVLVPAPILFLAFMGLQGRYFGRWLMPILPILCLLAAYFALRAAAAAARLLGRLRPRTGAAGGGGGGRAAGPGPPLQRPQRARARPCGYAHHHPRLDDRPHPARVEGGRRARLAR